MFSQIRRELNLGLILTWGLNGGCAEELVELSGLVELTGADYTQNKMF